MAREHHPQLFVEHDKGLPHGGNNSFRISPPFPDPVFSLFALRDINKRDDHPVNFVIRCPVRRKATNKSTSVIRLHLKFQRLQGLQYFRSIFLKMIGRQAMGNVREGPANVAGDQVENTCCARCITLNVQLFIQKDCGNVGRTHQVFQV